MHLYDVSKGFLGGYAIVGAHLPLAVGLGLAAKMKKDKHRNALHFRRRQRRGGRIPRIAQPRGTLEDARWCSSAKTTSTAWACPLQESLSTGISRPRRRLQHASRPDQWHGCARGQPRNQEGSRTLRAEGNGPYFVEAMTYRYRGHSMSDPELYRLKEEVEEYRKRDAIEALKVHMIERGLLDEAGLEEIAERVERTVDDAVAFAEASPQPRPRYSRTVRDEGARR